MDSQDLDGDGFGDDMQRLTFDDGFLCSAFEDMTPAWSPDSSLIAFASWRKRQPRHLAGQRRRPDRPAQRDGLGERVHRGRAGRRKGRRSSSAARVRRLRAVLVAGSPAGGHGARRGTATDPADLGRRRQERSGLWCNGRLRSRNLDADRGGAQEGAVGSTDRTKIYCGQDCSATFETGSQVQLTARARPGYVFEKWLGACQGTVPTCTVRLGTSKVIAAKFVPTS